MPIYALKTSAAWTADATLNGATFADVADPVTLTGLTNGTGYQAREVLMSPLSAEFTPAVSLLPFVDDFSTDTSANWTKFSGTGTLVVSGGVAKPDTTSNDVFVQQDVGVAANCKIRMKTASLGANGMAFLYGKYSDPDNWIRLRLNNELAGVGSGTVDLEKRVAGVASQLAARVITIGEAELWEMELSNSGATVTIKRSTTGAIGDLVGLAATFSSAGHDVSDVPASSAIGFLVRTTAEIDEIWADNV